MLYDSINRTEKDKVANNNPKINRVMIVAKADFTVHGIISLLESHKDRYEVLVVDPEDFAINRVKNICPDIMLLNNSVVANSIEQFTHEIHVLCKETMVLLFGHTIGEDYLYQAIRAGARGYLNEKMRSEHLITALNVVTEGGYWAERHILGQFISDNSIHEKIDDNIAKLVTRLSSRESEVLELILEGLTTNEIADRIYLSHQGVKVHLTTLFRKFEVKNRVQLIIRALDEISPVHSLAEIASKGLKTARSQSKELLMEAS